MLDVSGLNVAGSNVIAPNRKKENNPMDAIVRKIREQRAMVELKEIEEIKKKPKEERTLAERVKLASHNMEKVMADIDKIPTVIYVA